MIDADGDLLLPRRRPRLSESPSSSHGSRDEEQHEPQLVRSDVPAAAFTDGAGRPVVALQRTATATPLGLCGLQVWRGALLLADLLLHRGAAYSGATALELGAGVGLASLVLSRCAGTVFLTDVGADVLASCRDNADAHLQQQQPPCTLLVRQLDWLEPPDWLLPSCGGSTALQPAGDDQFGWRAADVAALRQLSLLLAADCFYDDVLTEACMRSAVLLMRFARRHSGRSPRLLVSLERRVCFTLDGSGTAAVRAPAYDFWRTLFEAVEGEPGSAAGEGGAGGTSCAQAQHQPALPLIGWQLDVSSVPQALQPYERTAELELWELALRDDAGVS